MYYADIKRVDVANGPGVRVSLFVSGCTHRCEGCFNPDTWDFRFGALYTRETEDTILGYLAPSYIRGLSLLGGEPFEPENQAPLLTLARRVRRELPEKTIWCYTGFLWETLTGRGVGDPVACRALLEELDVLVDGPFVLSRKHLSLRFRGSDNQRILDVPKSLAANAPELWAGPG